VRKRMRLCRGVSWGDRNWLAVLPPCTVAVLYAVSGSRSTILPTYYRKYSFGIHSLSPTISIKHRIFPQVPLVHKSTSAVVDDAWADF
jgi:hypothetical protein